jgi:large-conductance mechanosensitive channel
MEAVLAGFLALLAYFIIVAFALFVAYHLVSAAITLKKHSKKQTELLQEIKELLEKSANREESDDAI